MMGAIPICDEVFYLHDIVEYSQCPTKISPDVTVAYSANNDIEGCHINAQYKH